MIVNPLLTLILNVDALPRLHKMTPFLAVHTSNRLVSAGISLDTGMPAQRLKSRGKLVDLWTFSVYSPL